MTSKSASPGIEIREQIGRVIGVCIECDPATGLWHVSTYHKVGSGRIFAVSDDGSSDRAAAQAEYTRIRYRYGLAGGSQKRR